MVMENNGIFKTMKGRWKYGTFQLLDHTSLDSANIMIKDTSKLPMIFKTF
jgi:hypothetical protein